MAIHRPVGRQPHSLAGCCLPARVSASPPPLTERPWFSPARSAVPPSIHPPRSEFESMQSCGAPNNVKQSCFIHAPIQSIDPSLIHSSIHSFINHPLSSHGCRVSTNYERAGTRIGTPRLLY
eukprot:GHVU01197656.1.p1 GENE.GHVU01197656.1~~GHVU01197656.1.p1  ORF type:complete len:122 (-),score=1.98 GHVU01197656.1:230-595(-)